MKIEYIWNSMDRFVINENFERKNFTIKEGYISINVDKYELCVINCGFKIVYLKCKDIILEGYIIKESDIYMVLKDDRGEIRLRHKDNTDKLEINYDI